MQNIKTQARIAGLLYLLQIPLGIFGFFYVPTTLIVKDDVNTTIQNLLSNEFIYRLSIVSVIICALVTIFTANYITAILKPIHQKIAKSIVLFTIIVAPITIVNELNNIAVLQLIHQASPNQSFISFFLEMRAKGIHIADLFFGLWLLPMGYLVFKSTYIPKLIGILLLIAGLGYIVDFSLIFLFPHIDFRMSVYTWIGELLMLLWLLIKGVNVAKYQTYIQNATLK